MSTSQLFNLAAKTPAKIDIEEQPPALKSPQVPKVYQNTYQNTYQNESKWFIFRKECTTCPSSPHHIPITCMLFLCENQLGCVICAFLLYLHGPFPMCQSALAAVQCLCYPSGVSRRALSRFYPLPWHSFVWMLGLKMFKAQTPKGIQVLAETGHSE